MADGVSRQGYRKTVLFRGMFVWIIVFYFYKKYLLRDIYERKKHPCRTMVTEVVCFQMLDFEITWLLELKFVENYIFLKNYVTSEGAVSHSVLYHQPLPITRHQERFYANNYFE